MLLFRQNDKFYAEIDGQTVELKTQMTHGKMEVRLPKNDANRQFCMCSKITEEGIELEARTTAPRTVNKNVENYLTDDEKVEIENYRHAIDELLAKARARKDADVKKPLSPLEKAQRDYEKSLAKYNALVAQYQKCENAQ